MINLIESLSMSLTKLPYIIRKNYLPDFVHEDKKILIEAKGYFKSRGHTEVHIHKRFYRRLGVSICVVRP